MQEFKKLINQKLNLKSSKVKIPKRNSKFLYVCFRSEEDKDAALGILHRYTWKNTVLDASVSVLYKQFYFSFLMFYFACLIN